MPNSIAWGVLGTGTVAQLAMLPALTALPTARLLAVGSASRERTEACAARFAIPRAYGTYQGVLDDPDIQAVYIALPNALHLEWVLRAARAGKHILCEKPLGCALPEVEEMARASAESGIVLMEALMYRFHPRTERLHALLDAGAIGEPRHVSAAFTFSLADRANYRLRPELGGGALLDVGGYCVSAARAILGGEPLRVSAAAHYGESGCDESVTALLAYSAGRTAEIVCSFRAAEHQRLTVLGATGVLEVPLAFTAWHSDPAPLLLSSAGSMETLPGAPADPYLAMLERFTTALLGGQPAPYPLDETLATTRTLDAIARSARVASQSPR